MRHGKCVCAELVMPAFYHLCNTSQTFTVDFVMHYARGRDRYIWHDKVVLGFVIRAGIMEAGSTIVLEA